MSTTQPPEKRATRSEGYRSLFMDVFPQLVEELTDDGVKNPEISVGIQHLKEVLEYNVPGGKCNRGLMVIGSLRHLAQDRVLTEDEERKALILGWCIEWLQAFFLVSDDVMDKSLTRRGKPCWYKKEGVGLVAVNDALWIEGTMYKILRRHFRTEPYYVDIVELFHEVSSEIPESAIS
jgi:farnesyl diphosphate synthase